MQNDQQQPEAATDQVPAKHAVATPAQQQRKRQQQGTRLQPADTGDRIFGEALAPTLGWHQFGDGPQVERRQSTDTLPFRAQMQQQLVLASLESRHRNPHQARMESVDIDLRTHSPALIELFAIQIDGDVGIEIRQIQGPVLRRHRFQLKSVTVGREGGFAAHLAHTHRQRIALPRRIHHRQAVGVVRLP